jgi:calcium-translocating P-type ATPase
MTDYHHLTVDEVLAHLDTSRSGLSEMEAAQRLRHFGPNRLPEGARKTLIGVFLSQFRSPFIYLLLAAAGISLAIGHLTDAAFIFAVLLLNSVVGTYQEWQAETRAIALKALIKGSVAVWRGDTLVRLPADVLVPGDVVQVESGERIGADLRLIEARNLTVDESLLTGESLAVHKLVGIPVAPDAQLGDRMTMLHAGTIVQAGRGAGVVVSTGSHTIVGQLAATLEQPEPSPPLVRRMARFTRHLAVAMIVTIALIAALEAIRGATAADIFLLAIALTVSAIPEGLPVAMTVALSIAMHRMGLRQVVVRHLPAVEGLGACSLIATDKTGTLTLNRLSIERVWVPSVGERVPSDPAVQSLLTAGAYASEAPIDSNDGASGDAVDLAFFAALRCDDALSPESAESVIGSIPYEPEKRFAAAFHERDKTLIAYVKGAPETVASYCRDVDEATSTAADRMSAAGYRVIAVAAGPVAVPEERGLVGLRLLGFAGLIDPLRSEAQQAVADARHAGIRVVMVTGDHPLTALAIARQLGLATARDEVMTGAELATLEGAALDAAVDKSQVFARTEPLQKLAIVESLRRQGHVVAVTGDGVNDAPALHAADIGVAMGKGGTDVAREAADLILTDDNFASIVAGIEEGRIAYDNVRKVILMLVSTGAAEILLMLLATAFRMPPPLSAVQLLWLNLITNGMQDVALAFEKGEPGVLQRRPRAVHSPVFDHRMIEQVVVAGMTIGLSGFALYFVLLQAGTPHAAAQGSVLWILVWCENAHCFNCRSETRSVFRVPLTHNRLLVAAVVGTQLLQIAALSIPGLRDLLSLQALTLTDGVKLASVVLLVLGVMECYKWVRPRLAVAARPQPS